MRERRNGAVQSAVRMLHVTWMVCDCRRLQGVQGYSVYLAYYLAFMIECIAMSLVIAALWTYLVLTNFPGRLFMFVLFGHWLYCSACWGIAFLFRYLCAWLRLWALVLCLDILGSERGCMAGCHDLFLRDRASPSCVQLGLGRKKLCGVDSIAVLHSAGGHLYSDGLSQCRVLCVVILLTAPHDGVDGPLGPGNQFW